MQPIQPSQQSMYQSIQSYFRVLLGNISLGSPSTFDANGVGTVFPQDNGSGVLIRIGTNANPFTLPNFWAGTNVATTVVHNLNRVPIGFFVASKTKTCDVYNAAPFTATVLNITLYCTDDTADDLVYIF